jgi:hypothetical protein
VFDSKQITMSIGKQQNFSGCDESGILKLLMANTINAHKQDSKEFDRREALLACSPIIY